MFVRKFLNSQTAKLICDVFNEPGLDKKENILVFLKVLTSHLHDIIYPLSQVIVQVFVTGGGEAQHGGAEMVTLRVRVSLEQSVINVKT